MSEQKLFKRLSNHVGFDSEREGTVELSASINRSGDNSGKESVSSSSNAFLIMR